MKFIRTLLFFTVQSTVLSIFYLLLMIVIKWLSKVIGPFYDSVGLIAFIVIIGAGVIAIITFLWSWFAKALAGAIHEAGKISPSKGMVFMTGLVVSIILAVLSIIEIWTTYYQPGIAHIIFCIASSIVIFYITIGIILASIIPED